MELTLEKPAAPVPTLLPYTVRLIPPVLVTRFWPFALPYIKRALDRMAGEIAAEDFYEFCLAGDMQLWLIMGEGGRIVGAGTTELVHYPRRKLCRIVTLAGSKFPDWAPMAEPVIADWARTQGCDGVEAWVRRGFVPQLEALDYRPRFVAMLRDLKPPATTH